MIDENNIKENLYHCIERLIECDHVLFSNDVSERAITHKLAEYLQEVFKNYNVDCEYNRNFENGRWEPKNIEIIKTATERIIRNGVRQNLDISALLETVSAYPDIIIHKRLSNSENILIIEVKKSNNRTSRDHDHNKLRAFTQLNDNNKYDYILGAFIEFEINPELKIGERISFPQIQWFKNGRDILEFIEEIL